MSQKQITVERGNENRDKEYYAQCPNCIGHPHYKQKPVTLHRGDTCLVCHLPANHN